MPADVAHLGARHDGSAFNIIDRKIKRRAQSVPRQQGGQPLVGRMPVVDGAREYKTHRNPPRVMHLRRLCDRSGPPTLFNVTELNIAFMQKQQAMAKSDENHFSLKKSYDQ
jgi:hypothetical protein